MSLPTYTDHDEDMKDFSSPRVDGLSSQMAGCDLEGNGDTLTRADLRAELAKVMAQFAAHRQAPVNPPEPPKPVSQVIVPEEEKEKARMRENEKKAALEDLDALVASNTEMDIGERWDEDFMCPKKASQDGLDRMNVQLFKHRNLASLSFDKARTHIQQGWSEMRLAQIAKSNKRRYEAMFDKSTADDRANRREDAQYKRAKLAKRVPVNPADF